MNPNTRMEGVSSTGNTSGRQGDGMVVRQVCMRRDAYI